MASRGRPTVELVLTEEEHQTLTRWARRRKSSQALALRSRIVLGCAEGLSNKEVAARERVAQPTVGKWRRRFVEARCDGLVDDPRPGRPASVTAEQVEDVVVTTLESTPANATHWSRTSMAQRSGLSKSTIGRIWKAFALQPHRSEHFKLSNDPLFVEKVYDIVGLYLDPPETAVVLCVDKNPDPGPGPQPTGVSHDAGHAGETHPRLRPARHHQPVRRLRHQRRHGDLLTAPPPPRRRIQKVPHHDRRPGARPPRHPPGLRQLPRHPQSSHRADLAGQSTPASTFTTRQPIPAGSTRSNGGSPNSPANSSNAATTAASKPSKKTSAPGLPPGTTTQNRSYGPKPLSRSSNQSHD